VVKNAVSAAVEIYASGSDKEEVRKTLNPWNPALYFTKNPYLIPVSRWVRSRLLVLGQS
jgi:hypothetical protein